MTDSHNGEARELVQSKLGKRDRLVVAARQLLHQQGVERTTLADIAHAADVPVGNIYYYFKTKDELVEAVVAMYTADLRARLASFDRHRTPKARLKALVREMADERELAAQYGCPMGTLCSELDKRDDDLEHAAAELLTLSVDWAEQQFRLMGRSDARDLAVALVAANQGISLLTNTLRDPELMARESRRLDRWIDSLA
jgi:TetR/AcrR family transcriptional regulator, transcriptional repressor for nem operon